MVRLPSYSRELKAAVYLVLSEPPSQFAVCLRPDPLSRTMPPPTTKSSLLMLRRANTGWMDGFYSLPAGHVEVGHESVKEAMVREAKEEVGIDIQEKDLEVLSVMHRISGKSVYFEVFLQAKAWQGRESWRLT